MLFTIKTGKTVKLYILLVKVEEHHNRMHEHMLQWRNGMRNAYLLTSEIDKRTHVQL